MEFDAKMYTVFKLIAHCAALLHCKLQNKLIMLLFRVQSTMLFFVAWKTKYINEYLLAPK
jgi:hypothetical protein